MPYVPVVDRVLGVLGGAPVKVGVLTRETPHVSGAVLVGDGELRAHHAGAHAPRTRIEHVDVNGRSSTGGALENVGRKRAGLDAQLPPVVEAAADLLEPIA